MPAFAEKQYRAIVKSCQLRRCRNKTRCKVACTGIKNSKLRRECQQSCGKKTVCVKVCKATAARIVNAQRKRRR